MSFSNDQHEQWKDWIGKTESKTDFIAATHANSLAAALDRSQLEFTDIDSLPPLWHWLFFLEMARQSELSIDGHPRRGGFLPPIELPRRMWAGSRLQFHQPLSLNENASKTSTIKSIQLKEGSSGKLAFVCVSHEVAGKTGLAISEEQDIVYRDNPTPGGVTKSAITAPQKCDFSQTVNPEPALLFRYSALTLNSHRIHYDRDYAMQVEGYPGLVVHGPLLATLLIELISKHCPGRTLASFEFKAINPVFDGSSFTICGLNPDSEGRSELWVANSAGELCVKGFAGFGGC